MKEYINMIARNNFCVPAVLCSILHAESYSVTQEAIADVLGITVPINAAETVSDISNVKFSDNDIDWGVKIKSNSLNDMFSRFDIKLRETYIPINTIAEECFAEVLNLHLLEGEHIVCGFNYSSLYSLPYANYGHVSIICDVKSDRVILLDPGPKDAGIKSVMADNLYLAIRKRADGLWCISKIS